MKFSQKNICRVGNDCSHSQISRRVQACRRPKEAARFRAQRMMRILAFLVVWGQKSGALLPCVTAPSVPLYLLVSTEQFSCSARLPRRLHPPPRTLGLSHIQITRPYPSFSTARKKTFVHYPYSCRQHDQQQEHNCGQQQQHH